MLQGFLGKKIGMTQLFREDGRVVPVTVIEAGPCVVTQVKTKETDGYEEIQLGYGDVKRLNKNEAGHLKERRLSRKIREVTPHDTSEFTVGLTIVVDIFQAGEKIDVIGKSKGRGFAGTMKRWDFGGGPRTHGQSDRARAPGSIGGGTTPGKVYKGLKMSGHMGNRRITVKGLEIVEIAAERNLLMIKGGIPGATNSLVQIRRKGA